MKVAKFQDDRHKASINAILYVRKPFPTTQSSPKGLPRKNNIFFYPFPSHLKKMEVIYMIVQQRHEINRRINRLPLLFQSIHFQQYLVKNPRKESTKLTTIFAIC